MSYLHLCYIGLLTVVISILNLASSSEGAGPLYSYVQSETNSCASCATMVALKELGEKVVLSQEAEQPLYRAVSYSNHFLLQSLQLMTLNQAPCCRSQSSLAEVTREGECSLEGAVHALGLDQFRVTNPVRLAQYLAKSYPHLRPKLLVGMGVIDRLTADLKLNRFVALSLDDFKFTAAMVQSAPAPWYQELESAALGPQLKEILSAKGRLLVVGLHAETPETMALHYFLIRNDSTGQPILMDPGDGKNIPIENSLLDRFFQTSAPIILDNQPWTFTGLAIALNPDRPDVVLNSSLKDSFFSSIGRCSCIDIYSK